MITLIENGGMGKCSFSFNNLLLRSPLRYTMMERRFLYKLAEAIKIRYEKMGLQVRGNWDSLVFNMTDKDEITPTSGLSLIASYGDDSDDDVQMIEPEKTVSFHCLLLHSRLLGSSS